MYLSVFCNPKKLTAAEILGVPPCLARYGVVVDSVRIRLYKFQEHSEFSSLEEFEAYARETGMARRFELRFSGKQKEKRVGFEIDQDKEGGDDYSISVSMEAEAPREPIEAVIKLLALTTSTVPPKLQRLARTVFIAHKFDAVGTACADKVARFLELLGFRVATGRGYAPQSIAAKVRERLEKQAVVVALVTPGDDATWLVQESLLAQLAGKPLLLVRESTAPLNPGLLADHEYIPFEAPHIEQAFIPLLEGLRELSFDPPVTGAT
jgi:hypothetical protein